MCITILYNIYTTYYRNTTFSRSRKNYNFLKMLARPKCGKTNLVPPDTLKKHLLKLILQNRTNAGINIGSFKTI